MIKESVTMSTSEAERLGIMQQIDRKALTIYRASEYLGISVRQTKRIRKRYLQEGAGGLISRKRNRPSNRKIPSQVRGEVIALLKSTYLNFGPTLAAECLQKRDNISLSSETLRTWMKEEGLWKPKKRTEKRIYSRRQRRSRFGELLQGDGSSHDWFEGRGNKCVLLQFVDDATSKTTAALFVPAETTDGYLQLLKIHLEKFGRPLGLYVDKHSIFRVNREELQKGSGITHFGRVVRDLGIELICAHSPQAKGRVERKNGVMQDRLIKEMRLNNIDTIEQANEFLPQFLQELNDRFGKEPLLAEDAHRPLREIDELEAIFVRRDTRKLSKNLTFQHKGILYLVETSTPNRLKHATVEILWGRQDKIEVQHNGKILRFKKWEEIPCERPLVYDGKEIGVMSWGGRRTKTPSKDHPWR